MVYISNSGMPASGYVMQQEPDGGPMAVPVQGGGMVAVQVPTSAAVESHPQVQVSTSDATGGPPQFVQYAGAPGPTMAADQSQTEQDHVILL